MMKRIPPKPVTTAIIISTVGVVLVCTIAVLLVQHWSYSRLLQRQFQDQMVQEAKQLGQYYQRVLGDAQRHLDVVAQDNVIRVTLQLGVEYQLKERLNALALDSPYSRLYIHGLERDQIYGPDGAPVPREIFELAGSAPPTDKTLALTSDGRFYVPLIKPIKNRVSEIGSALSLVFFRKPNAEMLDSDRPAALLVSYLGVFRDLDSGKPMAVEYLGGNPYAGGPKPCRVNGQQGLMTETDFLGIRYFVSLQPLTDSLHKSIISSLFLLLATTVVCCILSYYIGHRITKSLRSLSEVARTISLGETQLPLLSETSPIKEVNDVMHAMGAMLKNLSTAEELGRYQTLFEEVVDAIFIYDLEGRILECNSQAPIQMGCTRSELLQMSIVDLTVSDYRQRMLQMLEMVTKTPLGTQLAKRRFQVRIQPLKGEPFHAEMHIRKLLYLGHDAVLGVVRDISSRVDAERALRKAKQEAEDANRAKSGFLAAMSHEIRTPMHSVLGLVDMLEGSGLNDEQTRYLDMLRNSGVVLLNLIDDILDFSKIEAGHVELEHIPFSLETLLERIFLMVNMQAAQKGLEIILYMSPDVPARVVGDPTKLQQVVLNLISNALKFTSLGHIVTLVDVISLTASEVTLEISVKDTGIGIPLDKQQAIFDVFTQADCSTTRQFGGTGLGLAITKRLVERLGGSISVESRPGYGSTFTFTSVMPLPEEDAPSATGRITELPLAGLRFLLVDDNAITLHYLALTLADLGAVSKTADSVQGAVQALTIHSGSSESPFDVIIMGSDLPELDAVSAHRQVAKYLGAIMPPTLLYMDTAHAFQGKVLPPSSLPVLSKPATPGKLLSLVAAVLAGNVPDVQVEKKPSEPFALRESVAGRLLIAEDSMANRMLLEFYLKGSPFVLDFAADGREAVEMFRSKSYDLVLMDIQMPEMDGYAATQAIRSYEVVNGRAPVPIIALTANAYEEDREKCLVAGCTDYMAKPAKKVRVLEKLARYLGK